MKLQVYNTLTRKKEEFIPIKKEEVSLYVCGVTVYDYCHIGHARANCAFDTIYRYLNELGYKVKYVQNFTDIDDKIIKRANELNIPISELTEKYIKAFFEDMDSLNISRATLYPRATNYIEEMQKIISGLLEKGLAYENNGDVMFAVKKFNEYGKLSGKILEELESGSRVEVSNLKDNPLDFVLWKHAKPGEPSWPSPWGEGRPGWHIECSAMSIKELGKTIDIHGGGADLIFPHHENEIAQSECYTGKPFVNYWLHNGFVNINDEKMSKSKKNFYTIKEIRADFDGETIRFYLQHVHYRKPFNFSFEGLKETATALERLYNTVKNIPGELPEEKIHIDELTKLETKFHNAMLDDFNTAEAIGALFEINKYVNKIGTGSSKLIKLGKILGLFNRKLEETTIDNNVQELINERLEAKRNKNFQRADEIRDLLKDKYLIQIEDTKDGTRWKKIT